MDSVVRPVDGDESLAEIAQRRLGRSDLRFGQHHSYLSALCIDDLAVLDLVLHLADRMRAALECGGCPVSGSSVISTSASSELVVGSQPGNSMPAVLRTTLRPPSHPTRYSRA